SAEFSEMINLFVMIAHAFAVAHVIVLSEFFAAAVFDTIKLRGESWQVAHEVLLVMLKRVEDSNGRLTLATVHDELYLNSVLDEAKRNKLMFFRSRGGIPRDQQVVDYEKPSTEKKGKFSGKFDSKAKPCPFYNTEDPKRAVGSRLSILRRPFARTGRVASTIHACDKFVSDKGN
ncbi:MAG: hypothetical protein SGPRY_011496, partial [Prymnesium sp.]